MNCRRRRRPRPRRAAGAPPLGLAGGSSGASSVSSSTTSQPSARAGRQRQVDERGARQHDGAGERRDSATQVCVRSGQAPGEQPLVAARERDHRRQHRMAAKRREARRRAGSPARGVEPVALAAANAYVGRSTRRAPRPVEERRPVDRHAGDVGGGEERGERLVVGAPRPQRRREQHALVGVEGRRPPCAASTPSGPSSRIARDAGARRARATPSAKRTASRTCRTQ